MSAAPAGGVFRPHDLLHVDAALAAEWDAPAWVAEALAAAPWVVVRRACPSADVPIGVRGRVRSQRFAARIAAADVREARSPAELCAAACAGADRLAVAARALAAAARAHDVRWGPAGAYGFELASGVSSTHADSDLDVVIDGFLPRAALAAFAAECRRIERASGVRIDAELVFADMGVALREFTSSAELVLVKTPRGPRLRARAW